ncbi:glycoside hydrolase family 26 protein [Curtobacterium sp. P97]|uniref:glycoside hydrolase family 26 protein n=1 Tax=Curtobacterium sp. P97 TaxID=2939562 RepID=UPI00203E3D11|nr:glycosyl hydrolase [Curtobacterium sp. P97]MCM3522185.1 glycoside hydrolase family 26 protein [Curtobacterium sp. P97]
MKSTTRALLTAGLVVALGATMAVATPAAPDAEAFSAANKATVLNYLGSIKGQKIVSGQHNKEPAGQPNQYTQRVKDITGVYPGLWGGDFLFNSADVANRQRIIDQAKTEWKNGALVSLTWHVCPPTVGSSCSFDDVKSDLSDAQWSQLVTNGTALNTAWKKRLDEIVPYLQQLKDAGVPAIFRPIHEMNEQWAWWGGRPGSNGSARLYQITHDYLVGTKGMTNLVWAWNVQDNPAGGFSNYYPGTGYVDVVTLDAWYKAFPSAGEYQSLRSIAAGKPIALAEVGTLPTAANLSAQPEWAWFMEWSEQLEGSNSPQAIKDTYYNPRVLHQGDLTIP